MATDRPDALVAMISENGVSACSDGVPEPSATSQHALVLDHLWLADALARRYASRGVEADDLRQVARCGLVEAAGRYDSTRGPFVSFAVPTITGVVKRYFRDHGWSVRPPRHLQQLSLQITSEWSDIAQATGHEPTTLDFAARLRLPIDRINSARCASLSYLTASLDDEGAPIAEAAAVDPGFGRCETRLVIDRALSRLDPAERDLLHMRFWQNRTQADIASELGTSQMQVSRLLSRSLAKLRSLLDGPELTPIRDPKPTQPGRASALHAAQNDTATRIQEVSGRRRKATRDSSAPRPASAA